MNISVFTCSPYQTNSYLLIDEDRKIGLIVDPAWYVPELVDAVNQSGVDITYIILTHNHSDHRAGLDKYKEHFPNAKVVAYETEAAGVTGPTEFGINIQTVPDTLVRDEQELPFGILTLRFLFTPGHTAGGMCIYIPEINILFSGDTLFRQSIGRTDFAGGSLKDIDHSIKTKLYTLPDETQVLPGHMGTTTIGFEKENNPFVFL